MGSRDGRLGGSCNTRRSKVESENRNSRLNTEAYESIDKTHARAPPEQATGPARLAQHGTAPRVWSKNIGKTGESLNWSLVADGFRFRALFSTFFSFKCLFSAPRPVAIAPPAPGPNPAASHVERPARSAPPRVQPGLFRRVYKQPRPRKHRTRKRFFRDKSTSMHTNPYGGYRQLHAIQSPSIKSLGTTSSRPIVSEQWAHVIES